MRHFLVVYPPRTPAVLWLDAVRLLLKPDLKTRAHITLRGPHEFPQDPAPWRDTIWGIHATFPSVGTFWSADKNTVFLQVDAPGLERAWEKNHPSYTFTPHVTVYDGESRETAEAVLQLLQQAQRSRSLPPPFVVQGLELLTTRDHSNNPRLDQDTSLMEVIESAFPPAHDRVHFSELLEIERFYLAQRTMTTWLDRQAFERFPAC